MKSSISEYVNLKSGSCSYLDNDVDYGNLMNDLIVRLEVKEIFVCT
jgi:hypothetical protein